MRELLGLDELRNAVSGAAPMPPDLRHVVPRDRSAAGGDVRHERGHRADDVLARRIPWPVRSARRCPGGEVKLESDGELCYRGGNVFIGYLNDPEKTAEAIDDDGWLHSGDIGEIDDEGYVRIVDRKKELIITAGGKNVSPANLEAALKAIPIVGQAAAIGDNRPFVSALVVLDPEDAPAWAAQQGIEFTDLNRPGREAGRREGDRRRPRRGHGRVQRRRAGQEGQHPRRGVAARLRPDDPDVEAQAPRRQRPVRGRDRRALPALSRRAAEP